MIFNSLHFLIFFPIVVLLYYIIPQRFRYLWLLIASYYFYMCWNASYALLLMFSTFVTWLSGLFLDKRNFKYRKICVVTSFCLNLAVLFFFKYFQFVISNISVLLGSIGLTLRFSGPDYLLLPVGISFYTFQALSYTMDVYRNEVPAEKNLARYALFVSFFPQLVAGPIERSKNLLGQLRNPKPLNWDTAREGVLLMIWGYFLKVVLADRIAIFVDTVYGNYVTYSGFYLIVATLLFAVQIYCDFAGYSVIAIGTAKILGIKLMENFNAPYLSASVDEFWKRWHISLSSWFRDYLYIPMGGNRKGTARKYVNKMVVFLVSGLWHGAQWSYIIWGGLNGIYQIIGELLEPFRERINKIFHLKRNCISHKVAKIVITFLLIDFSWIFFRAGSTYSALRIVKSIFTASNIGVLFDGSLYQCGLSQKNFCVMLLCIGILMFADICKYKKIQISTLILKQEYWCRWLIISLSVCLILLFGIWGVGYEEAKFIYFQF